ncbi:unnamed protein product [Cyprideis torosa]|uniref:adenylate cyclase n=1 Tax=Cyprideis torosa TaxID=163714 RepID=A0A7R8WF86_9CRUS|nr:unnamed protein product [Cyprideis torosa]CAG0895195.1 unnamed protein product [Cyprideis torosa]
MATTAQIAIKQTFSEKEPSRNISSCVHRLRYVQESTGSPVDMRVGIHTGAVLAGVLGQRQWHYDVYSKDVVLANKMEATGMPGRVHVSSHTLACLDDHFAVEEAFGEERAESLKEADLKTYWITGVLKQQQPEAEEINGDLVLIQDDGNTVMSRENSVKDKGESSIGGMDTDEKNPLHPKKGSAGYRRALQKELVNRVGHAQTLKDHILDSVTLRFRNPEMETEWAQSIEPETNLSFLATPVLVRDILETLVQWSQPLVAHILEVQVRTVYALVARTLEALVHDILETLAPLVAHIVGAEALMVYVLVARILEVLVRDILGTLAQRSQLLVAHILEALARTVYALVARILEALVRDTLENLALVRDILGTLAQRSQLLVARISKALARTVYALVARTLEALVRDTLGNLARKVCAVVVHIQKALVLGILEDLAQKDLLLAVGIWAVPARGIPVCLASVVEEANTALALP